MIWDLTKKRDFAFDDFLHAISQSRRVVVSVAVDHEAMRHAANLELDFLEIAHFDGRVIKNVEVLGAKRIQLSCDRRQAGRNLPSRGRNDAQR